MPTSITTAPGLTMSAVTNFALPMATMRMSACRVTAGRSRVRLWQTVTVASPPRAALHEHDRHRLADDVAAAEHHHVRARRSGSLLRTSICWMPCGVQGRNRGRPCTIRPTFSGWKASTSFSGLTASSTRVSSICLGSGNWTRMPWTAGSRLSRSIRASSSSGRGLGRQAVELARRCRPSRRPSACCGRRPGWPGFRPPARPPGRASRRFPV